MKKNKKSPKMNMKALSNIFSNELTPLTHDVIFSKLYRDGKNLLVSFCQTNTLFV